MRSGAECSGPLKVVSFASLYPNAVQPSHGVFVEERLRHLAATKKVKLTVVAPVPWFPSTYPRFGRYARFAAVPIEEARYGIRILHPRYPVLPKIGMSVAPALMALALLPVLRRLDAEVGGFELIDAHYFYPDGIAAVWLGKRLRKPVVVTSRGSDINWIPRYGLPRSQLRWAAARAQGLISVSRALGEHLVQLGVPRECITTLRNGVDLEMFRPLPEAAAQLRNSLGLQGKVLLSVGSLIERKGHHITLDALRDIPEATLLIVGEGPLEATLKRCAIDAGVGRRVRFLGSVAHADLPRYFSAADVSVLASSREGMPNVVLEALACGTPVVACDAEGVRELLAEPVAGRVVARRQAEPLRDCIREVLAKPPDRAAVRNYALQFGWDETTTGQLALFHAVAAGSR